MTNELTNETNFLLYTSGTGDVKVNVRLENANLWLTQKAMGELFTTTKQNISTHLKNIFAGGELKEDSVVKEYLTTAADGKNYPTNFYNLDAIISVGYRVNSKQATQFRIWATKILKEYIIKGFVLDDDRLKQGEQVFDEDYFRELLERVRSIRAQERRIYQQVTDIFRECCIDYDEDSKITKTFYAMIQNKFHYAITGQTAPEIIHSKADSKKPKMGLQTFKNAPDGRVLQADATVAKNYLFEKEIKRLERTVSGFFDYVERVIENHTRLTMEDMAESVNKFLTFNEYEVLEGKGKMTKKAADKKAKAEYSEFNKKQKIESDFDKLTKKLLKKDEEGGV